MQWAAIGQALRKPLLNLDIPTIPYADSGLELRPQRVAVTAGPAAFSGPLSLSAFVPELAPVSGTHDLRVIQSLPSRQSTGGRPNPVKGLAAGASA